MARQTRTEPTRVEESAAVVAALELVVERYHAHTAVVALAAGQAALAYARSRDADDRELVIQYVAELRRVESDAIALGSDSASVSMRGVQLVQSMLYLVLDATIGSTPYRCPILDEASRLAEHACLVAA